MTVEIKTALTRSVPANNVYRVTFEVTDAQNIELDVFCYNVEDATYSHVASVYDLESYPVGQDLAQTRELQFFRARTVTADFNTIYDATLFETVTKNRLKVLSVAWNSIVTAFTGSETVVVDSDTSS
jgi:hypothetical protein